MPGWIPTGSSPASTTCGLLDVISKVISEVDAIYLLHGYEESPGAAWEWARAKELRPWSSNPSTGRP